MDGDLQRLAERLWRAERLMADGVRGLADLQQGRTRLAQRFREQELEQSLLLLGGNDSSPLRAHRVLVYGCSGPRAGATVTVKQGATTVATLTTDSLGRASVNLDPTLAYTAIATQTNWTASPSTSLVSLGTVTLTMTPGSGRFCACDNDQLSYTALSITDAHGVWTLNSSGYVNCQVSGQVIPRGSSALFTTDAYFTTSPMYYQTGASPVSGQFIYRYAVTPGAGTLTISLAYRQVPVSSSYYPIAWDQLLGYYDGTYPQVFGGSTSKVLTYGCSGGLNAAGEWTSGGSATQEALLDGIFDNQGQTDRTFSIGV
jgi:hypothetical protein